MYKTLLSLFISSLFVIGLITVPAQAEVNSGEFGLILNGGVGTGASMYGIVINQSESSSLGTGPGSSFNFGFMANFSLIALHSQFYYATIKDLEWEENDNTIKTEGSGHFWTWDGTVGIKALTEEGDMGYTHIFVGFRIWKAIREEDTRTLNGVTASPLAKQEMIGHGFIAGIRDFSTLPLGPVSLALQTGLWIYKAPLSTLKINDTEMKTTADQNIGFGFEIGAGLAFEDLGLSAIAGLRMDVQATELNLGNYPLIGQVDAVAGAGYAQFFIAVSKEF